MQIGVRTRFIAAGTKSSPCSIHLKMIFLVICSFLAFHVSSFGPLERQVNHLDDGFRFLLDLRVGLSDWDPDDVLSCTVNFAFGCGLTAVGGVRHLTLIGRP